jgi:putative Mg2+ transporter-C (MgtC) family protein
MASAIVLGGMIGYERERAKRQAGLRTHLVVALASATFMLVSSQFVYFQRYRGHDLVAVDTSRIAASVATGIGFLGAGTILKTGSGIHGLTTAASLWLVAAVGLASGAGMYLISAAATAASLGALIALRPLEHKEEARIERRLALVVEGTGPSGADVVRLVERSGTRVLGLEVKRSPEQDLREIFLDAVFPDAGALDQALRVLEETLSVRSIRLESSGS